MSLLKLTMYGQKQLERHYRQAQREFVKEQKRRARNGGNIILKQARANIGKVFKVQTGELKKATKLSVRSRRGVVTATIAPKGRAQGYGGVQEFGLKVEKQIRKRGGATRGGRTGAKFTAQYKPKPFIEPAVDTTQERVFTEVGLTFEVLK